MLEERQASELREQVEMVRELCPKFDHEAYLAGNLTPVYFGSAINNFGVRELLQGVSDFAPAPRSQKTETKLIEPSDKKVSGFVFKIQANMDAKHRDRVAFARICSGHFKRGMKLKHPRSGKAVNVHNAVMFLAQERELAEEAFPGDIIGIPNHGNLRIGDTFTEGEDIKITGIPSFAPEILQRVRPLDPLRAKHLGKAVTQLAEEGVARVFRTNIGSNWIVGVVGTLQFDVLADRIRTEYDIPVNFETAPLDTARWLRSDNSQELKRFIDKNPGDLAYDHDDLPVFLARNAWHLQNAVETWPDIQFLKVREQFG